MANPFDEIDPRGGGPTRSTVEPTKPVSSNPFDEIDPRGGASSQLAAQEPPSKLKQPPAMFLSQDPSGRMVAAPRTDYNQPVPERGIIARAREGAQAPMQDEVGFSEENLKKYPWLSWLQPQAKMLDVAMRQPGVLWGGLSGAAAGVAEKAMGPAWADRFQRDVTAAPNALAGEVPGAASPLERAPRPSAVPPPIPPEFPPGVPRQVVRPQAGINLLPVETPHALPPERSGLSANAYGGPLTGISPETVAHMRSVMEEQGFTPHTIDQRLAEMSAHHFFGEITPSLEADMGAVSSTPGLGQIEVRRSMQQRAMEARERTQHEFDRAFGVNENVPQLRRIIEGDRARDSAPFYKQFAETVITPTPEIEALMPRLQASGAMSAANKAMAVEGEAAARGFPDLNDPPGTTRVPTATAFQAAKEYLDDKINNAIKEGENNVARRYVTLRNDVVSALDNHPNVGNVWQQARTTYAKPTEVLKAMEFGQSVLTGRIAADELPFMTAAYSPREMQAMRIGMRAHLEQILGKRDNLTAETINTVLSPNNTRKLQWALGDEAAGQLVNAIEHERNMHTAPTRIYGGSPTAHRLEAQKRWTVQPGMFDNVGLADAADAASHPFKTAATQASKFGLNWRKKAKEAKMERLREEASRIMTLQGPERDAVARHLVGGEDLPPRARGGRVGKARGGSIAPRHFARGGRPVRKAEGGELSADDIAAMSPETFVPARARRWTEQAAPKDYNIIRDTIESTASLPRRAFDASEAARQGYGYDAGPILEAATLPMGTGAIAGVARGAGETVLGSGAVRAKPMVKGTVPDVAAAAPEARLDVGPGLAGPPGGAEGVRAAELQAQRWAGERQPLPGLPQGAQIVEGQPFIPGPVARAHDVAERYMADKDFGVAAPDKYHPIDVEHAKDIAKAFDEMAHAPNDPKVKAAYKALADETKAQYEAIVEHGGLKVTPVNGADYPYHGNPRAVVKDVADNNHMAFFKTDEGFGSAPVAQEAHPMLQPSGIKVGDHDMLYNDLFRVVHDYFGHVKNGYGFRGAGEDNAWRAHAAMYSPEARRAMTTETRGQNSWLNYGPHGEFNRTASAADTIYAPQKIGLLPDWVMSDRMAAPAIAKRGLTDEAGLPTKGSDYTKASRAALDEIAAGPKGAGPLDLSTQGQIPNVPQVAMDRYTPPRGISPRMRDALENPAVTRGINKSIAAGKEMGADKWYHTEPVRRAFVNELGPEEGPKAFSKFMDMVSATSPRSDVPTNIRNGSFYYQHALAGKELPEKLPYPFGHVAQNLHRSNYEGLVAPRAGNLSAGVPETTSAWDIYKNPKPASFSQNLQGNLVPGTMDTHAFRNIAMRTGDPRFLETSISDKIKPGHTFGPDSQAAKYGEINGDKLVYRPQKLLEQGKLTMEEAKNIPTFWATKPNENEYAAAEALYRKLGKKAGLPTADAQAAAWSGAGELTGLGTVPTHTFPELFNERVLYTSKMRGETPQETLKAFITGKKPLLSIAGAAAAGSTLAGQHDEKFRRGGRVAPRAFAKNEAMTSSK